MKAMDLLRGVAIGLVATAMILPSAEATLVAKTVMADEFGYQT